MIMRRDKYTDLYGNFHRDELAAGISNVKCAVIGDIMLDQFLYGSVDRISPEAPIPVVNIAEKTSSLGGAGNVAANIRAYGAQVYLCGVLGEDGAAARVIELLDTLRIKSFGLQDNRHVTTTKTRVIGKKDRKSVV